jgi:putative ABC transport system permease protein
MEASSLGMGAMITFIGLYIGIIFALSCTTVLAIKQLSETSDNKERYQILRKLGADESLIRKSLFAQIGLYFMLPLAVALIHSFLSLPEVNKMVERIGNINASRNILLITAFIVLIYGGYFLATYRCSVHIIKEKRSLQREGE